MTYLRTNVYANGGDFSNSTILWYARGVAAMKERALADPTSWRFYGAIHGFDTDLWRKDGYISDLDAMPAQEQIGLYWNQCQHGSWYFLPWHRGYVLAIEAILREAIVRLGGPTDWALPYWNYFAPNENGLPPAFATRDWPDGKGDNPLFVEQRWGPDKDGKTVYVPLDQVNLEALTDPDFTGVSNGGDPGFGGVDTGYQHGGRPHGRLEGQPHDLVHVFVGGSNPADPLLPGLMTTPRTAGLDPIFWLHHANIDRLWEVWIRGPVSLGNPTEPKWLDGPESIGDHPFVLPSPDGTAWTYTPGEMANLATLDYEYDDVSAGAVTSAMKRRMERLREFAAPRSMKGITAMTSRRQNVEMVGASHRPLRVAGREEVRTSVQLNDGARRRVTKSFTAAEADAGQAAAPDRMFLNLENVRGLSDAVVFQVYVNLPEDANPADHPERLAGSVGLFGVTEATSADDEHGGAGLTFVLEITHIIDALHLENALETDALDVRILPVMHVPEEAQVSIGRVSLFRQGR
ncbi:MAG: tyrosinase [Acidobacteriota bacterium]|jgi:tyrosinase|nr:tyrosinase [Acidobacteriota bacterium]